MDLQVVKIEPNEKQKECIENINGTIMVLAGPGTGKTFTLIQRIKSMLQDREILPTNILCLTFSDPAASEMKERLVSQVGKIASGVEINTYHSFCNNIIRQYPSKFELVDDVNLIDDITKNTLMKECLDEFSPNFLVDKWNNKYFYLNELIRTIDEIKKNRLTKEQFFSNMKTHPAWCKKMEELEIEKQEREQNNKALKTFMSQKYEPMVKRIEKAKEVWDIFELYSTKMSQQNFIDFNDMVNFVVEAFENDFEFLQKVSKDYQYLFVDEYQDTNLLQNRLIDLIAQGAKTENIFVVGDDDQIIFGFQGAKADNLEGFLEKYPKTKVICLNENNRSTQSILDLSYKVISQDLTRLENNPKFSKHNISKILCAKNPKIIEKDRKIKLVSYVDKIQENNKIVENIEKIISSQCLPKLEDNSYDLSQIAILAREHKQLSDFARLLESKNIPFQIKNTKSIFEIKPSILIYSYLKILDNHVRAIDKLFSLLLAKPFEIDLEDYNYLLESNRPIKKDFITLINENKEYGWKDKEKIDLFIQTYEELKKLKYHRSIASLVIEVANRTGILAYYTSSESDIAESVLAIKRIYDEANSYNRLHKTASLSDFIEHLDTALNENIKIDIDKDSHIKNAIQLSTLHGSKGREFEYVFMPSLVTTLWEKKRSTNRLELPLQADIVDDEDIIKKAEQLKLLFVGITRAKHSLELSYSNTIDSKTYALTSYLSELGGIDDIVDVINYPAGEFDYFSELSKTFITEKFNSHLAFEKELKARLKDFKLSAHSFNVYKSCPRKFLYEEVYQIPVLDKDSQTMNFGNAIHKTLEWALKYTIEKNSYPLKESMIETFSKKLALYSFETEEKYLEFYKRGNDCIEKYYHHFISTPIKNIYAIEARFDDVKIQDYPIKGFIDRIEKNEDGSFALFDYKTGSARSLSSIAEGKEYEHYYNQLRFYKVAIEEKYKEEKVEKVGLIFVEEPEKNIEICLTKEDNENIKAQIIDVMESINNLNFDPTDYDKQSEKSCKYCDYKLSCKLNVI